MKILFVEDDSDLLSVYSRLFQLRGHEITGALSGASALLAFKTSQQIEVCVTDYKLNDMSGVELVLKLRALNPDLIFVILSAHDQDYYSSEVMSIPNLMCLQKPMPFHDLESKLLEILAHWKQQRHTGS